MNLIDINTVDGRRVFSADSEALCEVDWTAYARLTVDLTTRDVDFLSWIEASRHGGPIITVTEAGPKRVDRLVATGLVEVEETRHGKVLRLVTN